MSTTYEQEETHVGFVQRERNQMRQKLNEKDAEIMQQAREIQRLKAELNRIGAVVNRIARNNRRLIVALNGQALPADLEVE
jgi:chromosome segregation ATPase